MVDSHRDQLGRARQLAQALAAQDPQFAHRIWLVPDLVVVGKLTLSAGPASLCRHLAFAKGLYRSHSVMHSGDAVAPLQYGKCRLGL